jgi:hypothetical protein
LAIEEATISTLREIAVSMEMHKRKGLKEENEQQSMDSDTMKAAGVTYAFFFTDILLSTWV